MNKIIKCKMLDKVTLEVPNQHLRILINNILNDNGIKSNTKDHDIIIENFINIEDLNSILSDLLIKFNIKLTTI